MHGHEQKDLLVLAADKHISASLKILLDRRRVDLKLREISYEVRRHPNSDPGCLNNAIEFLRPFSQAYRYALVIFDYEGCGSQKLPHEIRHDLESLLGHNGWPERARVIVIDPEVEVWIWSHSGRIAEVLGWGRHFDVLRNSLEDSGLWPKLCDKPPDPKKAVRYALRRKGRKLSAGLFSELAETAAFDKCRDPAFLELRRTLQIWFPQ